MGEDSEFFSRKFLVVTLFNTLLAAVLYCNASEGLIAMRICHDYAEELVEILHGCKVLLRQEVLLKVVNITSTCHSNFDNHLAHARITLIVTYFDFYEHRHDKAM